MAGLFAIVRPRDSDVHGHDEAGRPVPFQKFGDLAHRLLWDKADSLADVGNRPYQATRTAGYNRYYSRLKLAVGNCVELHRLRLKCP